MKRCNRDGNLISIQSATTFGRYLVHGLLLFLCLKMNYSQNNKGFPAAEWEKKGSIAREQQEVEAGTKEETIQEIKKVALTYDDGPHPTYTMQVLEVLEEKKAPATFFLIGARAEDWPVLVEEIHKNGHTLGNHTYSHCDLCSLSDKEQHEELEKTSQTIESITGQRPDYVRAPFGRFSDSPELMTYIEIGWSVDTLDWTGASVAEIVGRTKQQVQDNGIILMHDQYSATAEATGIIIDWLRENGYEIVPLDEILFGY